MAGVGGWRSPGRTSAHGSSHVVCQPTTDCRCIRPTRPHHPCARLPSTRAPPPHPAATPTTCWTRGPSASCSSGCPSPPPASGTPCSSPTGARATGRGWVALVWRGQAAPAAALRAPAGWPPPHRFPSPTATPPPRPSPTQLQLPGHPGQRAGGAAGEPGGHAGPPDHAGGAPLAEGAGASGARLPGKERCGCYCLQTAGPAAAQQQRKLQPPTLRPPHTRLMAAGRRAAR